MNPSCQALSDPPAKKSNQPAPCASAQVRNASSHLGFTNAHNRQVSTTPEDIGLPRRRH